jgi:glycine dehydrogenase
MAGMKVVSVEVHPDGNLNLKDLRMKAKKHKDNLAACMVSHCPNIYAEAHEVTI